MICMLPYVHGPHLNHGPLGLAIPCAVVRLHVATRQLEVVDIIDGLLVAGVCFQLTTCHEMFIGSAIHPASITRHDNHHGILLFTYSASQHPIQK